MSTSLTLQTTYYELFRRREVTLERRKRAEEKKRLEEDKAKVGITSFFSIQLEITLVLDGCEKSSQTTKESGTNEEDQPLIYPFLFPPFVSVGRLAIWIPSHYVYSYALLHCQCLLITIILTRRRFEVVDLSIKGNLL